VRYHFLRDNVEKGTIVLSHVPTEDQLADIFTRPSYICALAGGNLGFVALSSWFLGFFLCIICIIPCLLWCIYMICLMYKPW
jgi:hypothetical protein